MLHNTITIELNGDVSLGYFAQAMSHFSDLIQLLTKNISDNADIVWEIEDLQAGSAVATIRGCSEQSEAVDLVVSAYHTIGQHIAIQQLPPYSSNIRQKVSSLTNMIGDKITSIRFSTPYGESDIVRHMDGAKAPSITFAYGAVKGTVETLTIRKENKFTLYDTLFDRAVACYFEPDQKDLVRDIWGQTVIVSGYVGRNPETGRPSIIRNIRDIERIADRARDSYQEARGIYTWHANDVCSEDAIRRLRDAV